jgi:hypothetical protein
VSKQLTQNECLALTALEVLTDTDTACKTLGQLLGRDFGKLAEDIGSRGITAVLADEMRLYRCGTCGGVNVETTDWVDANTNRPTCGEPPSSYEYCNDCGENVGLVTY